MGSADGSPDVSLEKERIELERYKSRLDYKKFVLGSVFAAIVVAAIPPLFQLATAGLEYVKSRAFLEVDKVNKEAERLLDQEKFRENYVKDFVASALNQDIELRIRLADYFSYVAASDFRKTFSDYRDQLINHRNEIRGQIDQWEAEWHEKSKTLGRGDPEIRRLERSLAWAYNEVGYVERDRSVAVDPRAPPVEQKRRVSDLTFFIAGMDIDADGNCPEGCESFLNRQNQTAFTQPGTRESLDPTKISFISLPLGQSRENQIFLGDFVAVYNTSNKKLAFAIFGDIGPNNRLGEGSIALAKELGVFNGPRAGSISDGIVYIVFPNSRTSTRITREIIDTEGKRLFERWGGDKELQRRLQSRS